MKIRLTRTKTGYRYNGRRGVYLVERRSGGYVFGTWFSLSGPGVVQGLRECDSLRDAREIVEALEDWRKTTREGEK
jgi:hypothetical protein